MSNKNKSLAYALPVFMAFFVMGFVDIVGAAVGFAKQDFNLSEGLAQLLPSMVFIWFLIVSVPTGIIQDRLGKRNTLNIGILLTFIAMILPLAVYSYPMILLSFLILGIGNTIVQVAANPLLMDVSSSKALSSNLSLSQFIKAIASLAGPFIAALFALHFGNWRYVFATYAVISLLSAFWLYRTPIDESKTDRAPATFGSCFALLKDPLILLFFIGILLTVGADVGMNAKIAGFLGHRFGISLEEATKGISIYFAALMTGRFLGAILLRHFSPHKFFPITVMVAIIGVLTMWVSPSLFVTRIAIFVVGLGAASIFPIIFALALERHPERSNEISGLLIMAVSGGALIPPVMGFVTDKAGQGASLFVLVACFIYLLLLSFRTIRSAKGAEK